MTKSEATGGARLTAGVATLSAVLFVFAFVAAPSSCEWGLDAYFLAGIAVSIALFLWALVAAGDRPLLTRVGLGAVFVAIGIVVWLGGLFAANVRIVCKLF